MAAEPVTEVLMLKLPEGQDMGPGSKSRDLFTDIMQTVLAQDGCKGGRWGMEVEDPTVLWAFLDWSTIGHHDDFRKSSSYKPFTERVGQVREQTLGMFHFAPSPFPPAAALSAPSAPVTELWHSYFDKDVSQAAKDKFEGNLKQFAEAIGVADVLPIAGGWSRELVPVPGREGEKGYVYLCCIGWDSIDAHMAMGKKEIFQANAHLMQGHEAQLAAKVVHYSGTPF